MADTDSPSDSDEDSADIYDDDVQMGMWYELMAAPDTETPRPPTSTQADTSHD